MPNSHQFSVNTVCGILKLAMEKIHFDLPEIFREAFGIDDPGYQALKAQFLKLDWKKQDSTHANAETIQKFIKKHNKKAEKSHAIRKKEAVVKKEAGSMLNHHTTVLKENEKSLPINSYIWSILAKQAFQNGDIVDCKNPAVVVALRIFIEQLKDSLLKSIASSKISAEPSVHKLELSPVSSAREKSDEESSAFLLGEGTAIQNSLLELIGQLCNINQRESAEAIHNFLYLGYQTLQNQKSRGISSEALGKIFGSIILDGLQLSKKIITTELLTSANSKLLAQDSSFLAARSIEGVEYKLFSLLTAKWLTHPYFSKPFEPKQYLAIKQDPARFVAELERLPRIRKNLSNLLEKLSDPSISLVQIEDKLANLGLNDLEKPTISANSSASDSITLAPLSMQPSVPNIILEDAPSLPLSYTQRSDKPYPSPISGKGKAPIKTPSDPSKMLSSPGQRSLTKPEAKRKSSKKATFMRQLSSVLALNIQPRNGSAISGKKTQPADKKSHGSEISRPENAPAPSAAGKNTAFASKEPHADASKKEPQSKPIIVQLVPPPATLLSLESNTSPSNAPLILRYRAQHSDSKGTSERDTKGSYYSFSSTQPALLPAESPNKSARNKF